MNSASPTIRERAAQSLNVASAATPEAVHAAFLRRLASEGFTPPEECIIAVNALSGGDLPLSLDGREERDSLQREAVEAFASAYWSLEPAQRRARWRELTQDASNNQAKSRLDRLAGGLDQVEQEHANPLVNEIATAVRALYVLGPRDRVLRRTSWLAERGEQFDDLRHAARRLRTDDPELAELEPEFLGEFTCKGALEPVSPIDSAIAEAERSERAAKAVAKLQEKIVKKRYKAQEAREEPSPGGGMSTKLGWFVLPIIILVVRLFISGASHTDRTTPTIPMSSQQEFENLNRQLKTQMKFTFSEVESFISYERSKAAGSPPSSPPANYPLWVLAGRPGAPADLKSKGPR